MILRGNNVIIKGLEQADLKERHIWLNDPEVTKYFTNLGTIPLSETDLAKWYESIGNKKSHELHFSIFTAEFKHIGGAQLKSIDWKNRNAELGIFIGEKDEWGKGYSTETTHLLIDYGFNTLNMHRIWLRLDIENLAALKCYQKAGFIQEGVFREEVYRDGSFHDTIVMSILGNEYQRL
jgi:Acetyltransferases, including N-acetylases of ribosomal proteins